MNHLELPASPMLALLSTKCSWVAPPLPSSQFGTLFPVPCTLKSKVTHTLLTPGLSVRQNKQGLSCRTLPCAFCSRHASGKAGRKTGVCQAKGKGPALRPTEGPSCPGAVCTAFLGGKWLKHREERMEKVTCSEGFLKPLISCGGSASSPEAPGARQGRLHIWQ